MSEKGVTIIWEGDLQPIWQLNDMYVISVRGGPPIMVHGLPENLRVGARYHVTLCGEEAALRQTAEP